MVEINIAETDTTPEIIFSSAKSLLLIKGNSYPENPNDFFAPIINKKADFLQTSADSKVKIEINLNYFNTSSNKCIINILRDLLVLNDSKKVVDIDWYYDEEDTDMHQRGFELSKIINHPFNLISFKSE
jgi:hypothetical protein